MKRPGFFHGVIVAAVLGFVASAIVATLTPFAGLGAVVRLVVPMLGLAYLLYLLNRSAERLGRVTTLTLWTGMAAVTWWIGPPLPLYLMIHVGAVWLIRSLYFYSGVMPALMDLGLSALSVSAAVWAITRSGSVFLATWCFFLVQALFVAIPQSVKADSKGNGIGDGNRDSRALPAESGNHKFENARRQADEALRQLFSQ